MDVGLVEIIMDVEDTFDLAIPEEMETRLATVADLAAHVGERLAEQSPTSADRSADEILLVLRKIVADHLGHPLKKVTAETSLSIL